MDIVDEIYQKAAALSEKDRAILAGLLIETLGSTLDPSLEKEWQAEIVRRMDSLDSGETKTVSWETVQAHLRARVGKP